MKILFAKVKRAAAATSASASFATTWGGVHLDEGRIPFEAQGVRNRPLNPADVRIVWS